MEQKPHTKLLAKTALTARMVRTVLMAKTEPTARMVRTVLMAKMEPTVRTVKTENTTFLIQRQVTSTFIKME